MLLQEEERQLLAAARDEHARRRLQESQGQYTKGPQECVFVYG